MQDTYTDDEALARFQENPARQRETVFNILYGKGTPATAPAAFRTIRHGHTVAALRVIESESFWDRAWSDTPAQRLVQSYFVRWAVERIPFQKPGEEPLPGFYAYQQYWRAAAYFRFLAARPGNGFTAVDVADHLAVLLDGRGPSEQQVAAWLRCLTRTGFTAASGDGFAVTEKGAWF